MFNATKSRGQVHRQRVDVDRSGVWINSMHIIDRRYDRSMIIPVSKWHEYKDHSDVICDTLTHQKHRVVRNIVPVEVDPDLKDLEVRDA